MTALNVSLPQKHLGLSTDVEIIRILNCAKIEIGSELRSFEIGKIRSQ